MWFGSISYSLYLWQQLFLVPLNQPAWLANSILLSIACVLAAALASHHLIEVPSRKYRSRVRLGAPYR